MATSHSNISWQETFSFPVISPNIKEHWKKKWTRNKYYKHVITAAWLASPPAIRLPCHVTLTRLSTRELDYDNLVSAFKPIRDTIADLLIPGLAAGRADNNKEISWEYTQEKGAKSCKITIKKHNTP